MNLTTYSLERLEKLEQETILRYFNDISLAKNGDNYRVSLYDSMILHLIRGDFDNSFLSESLVDFEESEKAVFFQLARNYSYLVFYDGNSRCWIDSVEGVTLQDIDLICTRLLDNYDFLLRVAKEGGEIVLKQLSHFQKSIMSQAGSVLDYLRNTFFDDNALLRFLIEISKEDGIYADLSNKQKIKMCTYLRNLKISGDTSSFELEKGLKMYLSESRIDNFLNGDASKCQDFVSMFLDINYNF